MPRAVSAYEQEIIISFDKARDIAHIFTYEKTWQKHLEKRLGLKPVMDNSLGGKDYDIEKRRSRPARAPVRLSPEARAKLIKRVKDTPDKCVPPLFCSDAGKHEEKGSRVNPRPFLFVPMYVSCTCQRVSFAAG
jgi:hypothetical protein